MGTITVKIHLTDGVVDDAHLRDTLSDHIAGYEMIGDVIPTVESLEFLEEVELDAVEPETLISNGDDEYYETPKDVWLRIADPAGPGSNWPVVGILGPRIAVRSFVFAHWGAEALETL